MITEQCASDEWRVVIEDMTVAVRPVRTRTLSAHRAAAAVRHAVVALAWKEA